jgi:hypothetical protein
MIRKEQDDTLTVSYVNAIPQRTRRVILTLRGEWKLGPAYKNSSPATTVEAYPKDNGTTEIHFIVESPFVHYSHVQLSSMIRLLKVDE